MEKICERNECTGCGLCSNICPKQAIEMTEDEITGHYIPKINEFKCVDCGLCKKKCPSIKNVSGHEPRITFAAWRNDIDKIKGSSSGGIAACFYENAIKKGYYIVGTCIDENLLVKLKVTNQISDIELFKSSKYVQAYSDTIYNECLEYLKKNEKILFIGTPCQCAAINSLANGEYVNNLIVVELICHGVPSRKTLDDYIRFRAKNKKITNIQFRSERGLGLTLYSERKKVWDYLEYEDEYMTAFQKGIINNPTCYSCQYAKMNRIADITIGDFWRIGQEIPFNKPNCKVSVVIANTEKGENFIRKCEGLVLEERNYQEAQKGNPNLYRASTKNEQYDTFWNNYKSDNPIIAYKSVFGNKLVKIRAKNRIKKILKRVSN